MTSFYAPRDGISYGLITDTMKRLFDKEQDYAVD
jgi:hypothetical protein